MFTKLSLLLRLIMTVFVLGQFLIFSSFANELSCKDFLSGKKYDRQAMFNEILGYAALENIPEQIVSRALSINPDDTNPFILHNEIRRRIGLNHPFDRLHPFSLISYERYSLTDLAQDVAIRKEFKSLLEDYINSVFETSGHSLNDKQLGIFIDTLARFESMNSDYRASIRNLFNTIRDVTNGGEPMWEGSYPKPLSLAELVNMVWEKARASGYYPHPDIESNRDDESKGPPARNRTSDW